MPFWSGFRRPPPAKLAAIAYKSKPGIDRERETGVAGEREIEVGRERETGLIEQGKWHKSRQRVRVQNPADMTNYFQEPISFFTGKAVRGSIKVGSKAVGHSALGQARPQAKLSNLEDIRTRLPTCVTREELAEALGIVRGIEEATRPGHCLYSVGRVLDWSTHLHGRIFHDLFHKDRQQEKEHQERVRNFMTTAIRLAQHKLGSVMEAYESRSFRQHYTTLDSAYTSSFKDLTRADLIKQYRTNLPNLGLAAAFKQMCRSKVQLNGVEVAWLTKMYYFTLFASEREVNREPSLLMRVALTFREHLGGRLREIRGAIDNALAKDAAYTKTVMERAHGRRPSVLSSRSPPPPYQSRSTSAAAPSNRSQSTSSAAPRRPKESSSARSTQGR